MRNFLLAGVASLALAPAPLLAQETQAIPDTVQAYPESTNTIDTIIPDATAARSAPAPTGDAVLDRLNALEAKIDQLEARNKQLEEEAVSTQDRVNKVEVRAARSVQPGPAPTFADVNGNFTFKPRGTFQLDYGAARATRGAYNFSDGTDIRRGRFGFDGTFFKNYKYRIEAEYVKGTVNLLDAYVQYVGAKNWTFTAGQQKAPYGLEANSTDALNSFLERGMANTAFGAVGAERRVGITAAYNYGNDRIIATVGIFGAGESVIRNATTRDEPYGFNGRVTFEPINDVDKLIHVGASAFKTYNVPGNALTLSDRPGFREDGGLLVSTGTSLTTGASSPSTASVAGALVNGPQTGVKNATYWGLEAAGVYGPFSVQGEYNKLHVDRYGAATSGNFDGYYVFGSFFLTGESRIFKGGVVDRVKPFADFNPANGKWGAVEFLARYDVLDLTDKNVSPLDRRGETFTGAINWYLNPNLRLFVNYIHFKGENSPIAGGTLGGFVATPTAAQITRFGTTAKGDAIATRLQVDF
jgi:phosphate-selective porin OprO/OprP